MLRIDNLQFVAAVKLQYIVSIVGIIDSRVQVDMTPTKLGNNS
jgi:hypothetical protein